MDPEVAAAWLSAGVAVGLAAVGFLVQVGFRIWEIKTARKDEKARQRRDALLLALRVIDHVYANSPWYGKPPTSPHEWDITLAWDAATKLGLYCKSPRRALNAFYQATGLHNPETQTAPSYGPAQLSEFREIVREELELPESGFSDPDLVWIAKLPGATRVNLPGPGRSI